jgi:anti-sigma regulatory factor (Ser/Thr protein kinase)
MRPHHVARPESLRGAPSSDAFPGGLFEMTLAGRPDAAAMARVALTERMTGHVDQTTLADAQLLLGELLANCVRHADTPGDDLVSVRVGIRGDALHLEVHARGFGLNVVDAVSRRRGVARDSGTCVGAEIGIVDSGVNDSHAA